MPPPAAGDPAAATSAPAPETPAAALPLIDGACCLRPEPASSVPPQAIDIAATLVTDRTEHARSADLTPARSSIIVVFSLCALAVALVLPTALL
jgi:hypothetical protein